MTMMSSLRRAVIGATTLSAAVWIAAGDSAAQQPARGGTLTWVASQAPQHFVPALGPQIATFQPGAKIHETLVRMRKDGGYDPVLATSWDASADGKTFTFKLRQGVKWHDGKDFTSEDVAFSMMEMWKTQNPFARGVFGTITESATPDPHTVIFRSTTALPTAPVMQLLASYGSVAPKHIYAGTDMLKNPKIMEPIGTGPFKFREYKRGEYILLERNPNYWDSGKPYLERIIIRYMNDAGSRAALLESGEAHFGGNGMVGFDELARFRKMKTMTLDFEGNAGVQGTTIVEVNLRNQYLANQRVRQAISHAIDRKFIVDNIFAGFAKPAWSPVPAVTPLHNPNVQQYAFDPKKAEQLLDEAGFKRGAGNMRFKITMDASTVLSAYGQIADYMKQALATVGIDLEVRKSEELVRLRKVYTDYDFDLTVYNLPLVLDPQISVVPYFWTKTIAKGRTNTNAYDYKNPAMDKAIEAASVELNAERRKQLYFEVQKIAAEDLPIIFLVEPANINTISAKVQNAPTNQVFQMTNWADVWLKP